MNKTIRNQHELRTAIDHARQQVASGHVAPLNAEEIILKARRFFACQIKRG